MKMAMTRLAGRARTASRVAATAALTCLQLGNAGLAAAASPPIPEVEWDTSIVKFQFDSDKFVGQRLTVKCPPRSVRDKMEAIYGTDVYPSDTPICVAAVHAGATAAKGGQVTIQLNPGAKSYSGSSRNGITSQDLPATQRSIAFVRGPNASLDATQREYMPRLKWDTKFTATGLANRNLVGQRFAFLCPPAPDGMRPRRIVGTDRYEFHTRICVAALHAGKITTEGGPVLVQLNEGVPKLKGSIRNGIESHDGPGGSRTLTFVDITSSTSD